MPRTIDDSPPAIRAVHQAETAHAAVEAAEAKLAEARTRYYDRVANAMRVAEEDGVYGPRTAVGKRLGLSRQRASELGQRATTD